MKKVTVTADPSGQAIVVSRENPEYGYVRVEQIRETIDERGWLRIKPVSALILGKVSDLRSLGFRGGQELEGKIVIRESLTPFNKKFPEKDLKIAGETGVTCTVDGKPIYRKAFYSRNPNAEDVLIQHTNTEEIRDAYAKILTSKKSKANLNI